jgi:hypothetical protein
MFRLRKRLRKTDFPMVPERSVKYFPRCWLKTLREAVLDANTATHF